MADAYNAGDRILSDNITDRALDWDSIVSSDKSFSKDSGAERGAVGLDRLASAKGGDMGKYSESGKRS